MLMVPGCRGERGRILGAIFGKKAQYISRKILLYFPDRDVWHPAVSILNSYVCQTRKYISIFSESQVALKALQADKTKSTLTQKCQKLLNNISTRKKDKIPHGNAAYMVICWGLISTQKQDRIFITGTSPNVKNGLLSFNRTQSRAVTDVLTGHNTLRRQLYIMGRINILLCRRCGAQEQSSAHVLSVNPWLHADTSIWARFFGPRGCWKSKT